MDKEERRILERSLDDLATEFTRPLEDLSQVNNEQLDSMVGRVVTIESRYGWSVGKLDVTANRLGRYFQAQPVDGYQFYLRFLADDVKRIDEDERRIILK